MKTPILAFLCALSTAFLASGQVPSLINYQGRLTDANGAAVTGNKNFSIDIFDAATGGNLLYTETIGAVTLDSNGVYSFQFGSAGTSNKQVTETIGTTDGTTLVYSKALANSSVVNNSITVTDGTNSWSQSVGNPGVGATATANTIVGFVIGATITSGGSGYTSAPEVTISGNGTGASATATLTDGVVTGITIVSAGSGYTNGATITIGPPVIPFRVEYSSGTITATYANAPTAAQTIAATYRYGTSGITDALANNGEQWMDITVDGVTQGARQRVLAVPFAINSKRADIADYATDANDSQARILASTSSEAIARYSGDYFTNITSRIRSIGNNFGDFYTGDYSSSNPVGDYITTEPVLVAAVMVGYTGGYFQSSPYGSLTFHYYDGTSATLNWNGMLANTESDRLKKNPNPSKPVVRVSGNQYYEYWYAGSRTGNAMQFTIQTSDVASIKFAINRNASKFYVCPVINDINEIESPQIKIYYDDQTSQIVEPNTWIELNTPKTILFIEFMGKPKGTRRFNIPGIRLLSW